MPGLDGLRGYAVVAVVFGHAMNHENVAAIGVTVFFSLSGFLITSILMDEYARCGKIDVRAFILRRFWRLAPALLALLVVVASVLEFRRESLLPVLAAGTYVANVAAAASVPMRSLAHTWSLALEEQFYVVWPLVLGYFLGAGRRRALGWAAVSLAVASAACRIALLAAHHGQMATRLPVSRADAILVGCALAITWRRVSSLTRTLAGAGGVGILIAASFAPDIEHAWWGLMVAEAAATAVVGWCISSQSAVWCSVAPRVVGRISYAVYLWHFPIYYVIYQSLPPIATFIVSLGGSLLIAAASWRWLELPLQQRHRDRVASLSPPLLVSA